MSIYQTYVNDFPWKTIGGAIAAMTQKPICSCIIPKPLTEGIVNYLYGKIPALCERLTYQVKQEKPTELECTICPAYWKQTTINNNNFAQSNAC